MPSVAENRSSKWDACRTTATHLEYCLRDNNYRPTDCVPEILDLKECCQIHEWLSKSAYWSTTTRGNNHRHIDCVPGIFDLMECCQLNEWKSIHCGYVPDEEPAPPPKKGLMIEPQVDPIQAEQMFMEFVEQLVKRGHAHSPTKEERIAAAHGAAQAAAHAPVDHSRKED